MLSMKQKVTKNILVLDESMGSQIAMDIPKANI